MTKYIKINHTNYIVEISKFVNLILRHFTNLIKHLILQLVY